MKVSEAWLREWVNPSLTTEQLSSLLTMGGLEVDSVAPVAGAFSKIIVAEVLETSPHPQADRLTLCVINTGKASNLHVVCGAKNVRPGLRVALAQIGTVMPSGMEIKETKLRGELSQGMLCSASELGLSETSEGILELDAEAPVGMDFREYLQLDDQILDVDLTPNRADCLSIQGVAREVSALTGESIKSLPEVTNQVVLDDVVPVIVKATSECPQYCGRVIRGIRLNALTPLWIRERLRRAGIRSIHPVVDVTNYVMLELGQPMHAFDLHKIQGGLTIRLAKDTEALVLLDGSTAKFSQQELVIADDQQILALAGVMGGVTSSVHDETTDIFLESAFFAPTAIAGVARRFGLNTDSAQRFERGVDPTQQCVALERATSLLLSIVGGEVGPIVQVTQKEKLPLMASISFHPERVQQLIGLDLPRNAMVTILRRLGMQVNDKVMPWQVEPPAYRFDIALDVDLIEEIVRIHGYDSIPREKMIASLHGGEINSTEKSMLQLTPFFVAKGYREAISYSFVDPKLQQLLFPDISSLNLINPISSELSSMRVSLWPGLLASLIYNLNRQQTTIKLFETGVIFTQQEKTILEEPVVSGLVVGKLGEGNWLQPKRLFDFYDVKGDLQALFHSVRLQDIVFKSCDLPALHPGKSAEIHAGGQLIGWCGVLHPLIAEALDICDDVVLFELKLSHLSNPDSVRYQSISKFPSIRRDLSLLVDKSVNAGDIEQVIRDCFTASKQAISWLKSFEVFDVYLGDSIKEDKKSLAISLVLQDEGRTLVDSEINEMIHVIIENLREKLAITWRE